MPTGQWIMKLKNGLRHSFYHDSNGEVSPLERIKDFDKGDFWSIDAGSNELLDMYEVDEDDNSFCLIPKSEVDEVFFEKY